MTNAEYEEVGTMFKAIESTPMEGEVVKGNDHKNINDETGLLKDKA